MLSGASVNNEFRYKNNPFSGLCGHFSSNNPKRNSLKINEDLTSNTWSNNWLISPKESLFEAWMSVNPNLNLEINNTIPSILVKNGAGYYILASSDSSEKICVPVDKVANNLVSNGENTIFNSIILFSN